MTQSAAGYESTPFFFLLLDSIQILCENFKFGRAIALSNVNDDSGESGINTKFFRKKDAHQWGMRFRNGKGDENDEKILSGIQQLLPVSSCPLCKKKKKKFLKEMISEKRTA